MKTTFKKGQRVVCIHYKAKPIVTVDHWDSRNEELWVNEPKCKNQYWWGPLSWFKPVRKKIRTVKKPRGPRGLIDEGSLCDNGIPGCTCNQLASVAQ